MSKIFYFILQYFIFFATHGHNFGVKSNLTRLMYFAEEKGFDVVLFGHTHIPCSEKSGDILFVNPGTLEKKCKDKTYAYIVVNDNDCVCKIVNIKENF